ncbi:FadR/GntR family transcriptional regulator [Streptomyces iranensis]|uniref:DNA-binding FadR family transcriptional regulator n=1 Tax=Streptomyces iranensis TaxID=576784 RepID=A0ABS4MUT5_9ACTN|nr:FCD domain-containing protein [Streptomyces iranensis]MBP2063507.1 DNA-binding FadR family transcriptional regulator [Streptomyces iranensis]
MTATNGREGWVPVDEFVRAPKAAEIIAKSIRRRIVLGELREGDTLPSEADLMAQFGVSRPTLREAFRIMEAESLISIRRGARGGARVLAPDLSVAARYVGLLLQLSGTTIGEVYDTRVIIEPAAVHRLATRRKERDLEDLRACVEELRKLVEAAKADPGISLDAGSRLAWRFHELLIERAGNRAMAIQWGVLRDVMETHLASAVSRSSDRSDAVESFRRSVRSYSKLVAFLEAKDAEGAQRHWRKHMDVSSKILLGTEADPKAVVDLFD